MSGREEFTNSDGPVPEGSTIIAPADVVKRASATFDSDTPENQKRRIDQSPGHLQSPKRIGEFTVLRELGRGGMGIVYEAVQDSLNRRVALKVLPFSERTDRRQILRFQNEARAAAQLNHPGIVPVHSVGAESGLHYYTMQLIAGRDIATVIRQTREIVQSQIADPVANTADIRSRSTIRDRGNAGGAPRDAIGKSQSDVNAVSADAISYPSSEIIEILSGRKNLTASRHSFESVVRIGIQASDALSYAHQVGIVHRDIKPSNLMLDEAGKLWVTDFGLAQIQGASALTMSGEVIGTLRYMSPEQALGQRVAVDQRTDIYSLGITLYELLTLKKAFTGETSKELIRQVCFEDPIPVRRFFPCIPEDLATIVEKAISKNPDDRYQSAQELADDLRRLQQDTPILARRPNPVQRVQRWVRQNTALATAFGGAGIFSLILTMIAAGMIWNSRNAQVVQRKRAESLLDKSEGLRLLAEAGTVIDDNPGLAMLMAIRGTQLAPGVEGNSAVLNTMGQSHELRSITPRPEICHGIAVNPDGTTATAVVGKGLIGKQGYPAIEFNVETGETTRVYDIGTAVTSAAYSPDGRYLLTAAGLPDEEESEEAPSQSNADRRTGSDAAAALWDTKSGSRVQIFAGAGAVTVSPGSFSPDSKVFALPGPDGTIRIYSAADGSLHSILKGHTDQVTSATFHADGRRLVSTGRDSTVRVWSMETNSELRKFPVDAESTLSISAGFGSTSDQILIAGDAGTRLLSLESGEEINDVHWPETAFRVTRNGEILAVFDLFDKQVTIRSLRTGTRMSTPMTRDRILSADLSDDGKLVLITTTKEALVFRTSDGTLLSNLKGHTGRIVAGLFVAGTERVITSSYDLTVRCWSVPDGNARMRLHQETARTSPSPWSFSSDSSHVIAAARATFQTEILNADGTAEALRFPGNVFRGIKVAGKRMITADERNVYVTQADLARELARFTVADDRVHQARAFAGTDVVAVLLESGKLFLWNITSDQRRVFGDPNEKAAAFDIHTASGNIAVAHENGTCLVLNGLSHEVLVTFPHRYKVLAACFDASGSELLTVDSRNTVRLWSLDQKMLIRTFSHPDAACDHACFSADGSTIVTWLELGRDRVRFWNKGDASLKMESPPVSSASIHCHPTLPLAAMASIKDGLWVLDWNSGTQRQLNKSPARSPVFHQEHIVALEADSPPDTAATSSTTSADLLAFVRSSLVSRDIITGEITSSRKLDGEGFRLTTTDTPAPELVLSVRQYNADIIRMEDCRHVATVGNHSGPLTFQTLTGNGGNLRAVCASLDGTASIFDLSGQVLHRLSKHTLPIRTAAADASGRHIVMFDVSGSGSIWNIADGAHLTDLVGHTGPVPVVRFSHSGNYLTTAANENSLHIRDITAKTERVLPLSTPVIDASWFPDDQRLLVITKDSGKNGDAAGDQKVPSGAILVDVASGKQTGLLTDQPVRAGKVSPDGQCVLVLTDERTVRLFRTSDGAVIEQFSPTRRPVDDIAFSPDSLEVLLRHDGELSLWEISTGTEICRIPDSDSLYRGGALQTYSEWTPFTPDGQWILSALPGLQKWPRDPLTTAVKAAPRPFSHEEIQRYGITLLTESGNSAGSTD